MLRAFIVFLISMAGTSGVLQDSPFFRAMDVCARDLLVPADRLDQYRLLIFPDDHYTHCVVRCIMMELRTWHDREGVRHSVLQQYFSPQDNPADAYTRVQSCLAQVVPAMNNCAQAYWSLNCYKQLFGNFFFSRDQFVPYTQLQLKQIIVDCADKLDLPRAQTVTHYHMDRSDPRFPCLVRCCVQTGGLYDDDAGLLWDPLYVMLGGQEQRETFLERVYRLVEGVRSATPDKCAAAEQLMRPLGDHFEFVFGPYLSGVHLLYDLKEL